MLIRGIPSNGILFLLNAFHSNEFFPLHIFFIFLRDLSGESNGKNRNYPPVFIGQFFGWLSGCFFHASKNVTANQKYLEFFTASRAE